MSSSQRPPRKNRSLARFAPRAVIFDFDGVIVHSEPLHFAAMRATLQAEGIELTEQEYFSTLIGFDDRGAFRKVFADRGLGLDSKTLLRVLASKSRKMKQVIDEGKYFALPGVAELVRALWRNYPLAICSGALREEIEAMLEGIGLRDCFPTLTAAEDVTIGKPDPQGYLITVGALSTRLEGQPPLTPADTLIIEDAPSVIREARNAGFRTLGVIGTYRRPDLTDADAVVDRLSVEAVAKIAPKLRLGV
jgi:beta-phosphoglucomutase